MNSDYIELRARSAFSFLEGASTPEDLATRAAELGYRQTLASYLLAIEQLRESVGVRNLP